MCLCNSLFTMLKLNKLTMVNNNGDCCTKYQKPLDCFDGLSQTASRECGCLSIYTFNHQRKNFNCWSCENTKWNKTHAHTKNSKTPWKIKTITGNMKWSIHLVIDWKSILDLLLHLNSLVNTHWCTATEPQRLLRRVTMNPMAAPKAQTNATQTRTATGCCVIQGFAWGVFMWLKEHFQI